MIAVLFFFLVKIKPNFLKDQDFLRLSFFTLFDQALRFLRSRFHFLIRQPHSFKNFSKVAQTLNFAQDQD